MILNTNCGRKQGKKKNENRESRAMGNNIWRAVSRVDQVEYLLSQKCCDTIVRVSEEF